MIFLSLDLAAFGGDGLRPSDGRRVPPLTCPDCLLGIEAACHLVFTHI